MNTETMLIFKTECYLCIAVKDGHGWGFGSYESVTATFLCSSEVKIWIFNVTSFSLFMSSRSLCERWLLVLLILVKMLNITKPIFHTTSIVYIIDKCRITVVELCMLTFIIFVMFILSSCHRPTSNQSTKSVHASIYISYNIIALEC